MTELFVIVFFAFILMWVIGSIISRSKPDRRPRFNSYRSNSQTSDDAFIPPTIYTDFGGGDGSGGADCGGGDGGGGCE